MTEPVQYVTKPAHAVQAIQFDGSQQSIDAILNWYSSYHVEEITNVVSPAGTLMLLLETTPVLDIDYGQYLYMDEDGFHVASKGAFEIYYKLDSSV